MRSEHDERELSDELGGIALDTVREVRSNKFLIPLFLGALCIAAIIFFATSIFPLIKQAENAGQFAGESSGHIAGLAVGSVEGATQGIQTGYTEGKEEGLSAKDTTAEIANIIETNINDLGKLEVLVANVDLTTFHEQGSKYAALYQCRGRAVFTIELKDIVVTYKDKFISIVLPQPDAKITINPADIEVLADNQRKYFNGTDSDGFKDYLNTFAAFETVAEEKVSNYTTLLKFASDSAVKQVEEIAYATRGNNDIKVTVSMQSN